MVFEAGSCLWWLRWDLHPRLRAYEACLLLLHYSAMLATAIGFEPIPPESKSGVLPLHYTATYTRLDVSRHLITEGECICLRDRSAVNLCPLGVFRVPIGLCFGCGRTRTCNLRPPICRRFLPLSYTTMFGAFALKGDP